MNWNLRLLADASESTSKEGGYGADLVTDPDYQGDVELLLHHEGKEEYVWNTRDPPGCLLVLPCPVCKDSGKLQPNPSRTSNAADSSVIKV